MSASEIIISLLLLIATIVITFIAVRHCLSFNTLDSRTIEDLSNLFHGRKKEDLPKHIRLIQMETTHHAEEDEFSYYPVKIKSDNDPKDAS